MHPRGGTWAWLHNVRWLYVFILAFAWSQVLTPLVIKAGWYFKILDHPGDRKIHANPIPRIGGLAIFLAVLLTNVRNFQFSSQLVGLLAGSSIIYIIGLIDDISPLSALTRLTIQIVACIVVIQSGVSVSFIPATVPFEKVIEGFITAFWLIGIANAINFLDGVDGLASGMAALCAFLFFLIALPTHQHSLIFITIAVAGAVLGYLPFNWKPAHIFLGDSGATFLGFLLAGLAVMGSWGFNNPVVAFSTPLLILSIPIFDMIYTTISRIRNGHVKTIVQWLEYASRDHFHHRLMNLGLSEVQTVIFIIMLNFMLGLGALTIRDTGTTGSLLLLTQTILIFVVIVVLMLIGKKERTPL